MMAIAIDLQQLPRQSFSVTIGDSRYDLTIKESDGIMSADIVVNDETIISGSRITAFYPIINYAYLESGEGNFIITTEGDEAVFYESFGVTQFLYYVAQEEIDNARSSSS
jgi:hypothetical protein